MFTIQDYIDQLKIDKQNLVNNLITKGITASSDETFTTLVPKVLDITILNAQSKSETITTNTTTTISPDAEYNALSSVEIITNVQPTLQSKSETITTNTTTTFTPGTGYDGLSSVSVTTNVVPDLSEYYNTSISGVNNQSYSTPGSKLIKNIPFEITIANDNLGNAFYGFGLVETPTMNTSSVTNMTYTFSYCLSLTTVKQYNTSNVTNFSYCFSGCSSLETAPSWDLTGGTNFWGMFATCPELKNVPLYNCVSSTDFRTMFNSCYKLTDTSLDNILQMCISATSYSRAKTLVSLGIDNTTYYPTSRIEALPHYSDFITAGWTIS